MSAKIIELRDTILSETDYEHDELTLNYNNTELRLKDYVGLNLYFVYNGTKYDIEGKVDGIKVRFTDWSSDEIISILQCDSFFFKYKRLSKLFNQTSFIDKKVRV